MCHCNFCFSTSASSMMLAGLLKEASKHCRGKQRDSHYARQLFTEQAVATQEWFLHLDLLNYEEAVDRLYDCLLLLFLTLALLNTVVQLSMYAPIPWLQPARLDKCSLQARITVTSGHCHSSCALKHHLNDTKLTRQQQVSIKPCIGGVFFLTSTIL